jgi:Ran GTPase-activating protein (RanGAP) involved in mRNA processing and transport
MDMKRRDLFKITFLGFFFIQKKGMTRMKASFKSRLLFCLKSIATKKCLQTAIEIENDPNKEIKLELRDAGLDVTHIKRLGEVFASLTNEDIYQLKTLSFSYNNIGDMAVSYLSTSMPHNLRELGLVGCSITDTGGKELLKWLKKTSNLKLLCIENNKFKDGLKDQFRELAKEKKGLYLVV